MKTLDFGKDDLKSFKVVEGNEALAQRIRAYLMFFENDYFLNYEGFGYIIETSEIETQKRKITDGILSTFKSEVERIEDVETDYDNGRLYITMKIKTVEGGGISVGNQ